MARTVNMSKAERAQFAQELYLRLRERCEPEAAYRTIKRGYAGARGGNLFGDFTTTPTSIDYDVKSAIRQLRARSRDLEQNNSYFKRWLDLNVINIVGATGIRLDAKARTSSGDIDRYASSLINEEWLRWCEFGIPTADGTLSFHDLECLIARSVARDGGILLRHMRGFDNEWGYAVQVIEIDHLDLDKDNIKLPNGNHLRMGVEMNSYRRPVAYWLRISHPGDSSYQTSPDGHSVRIPAADLLHVFMPIRAEQTIGVPGGHTAISELKMIGAYREAEVVAARYAASKMGVIINKDGQQTPTREDGGVRFDEIAPGLIEELYGDQDFKLIDPTHPAGNFGPFLKHMIQGLGVGLSLNYPSISGDLSDVNFSSIRQGVIDERSLWRMSQNSYSARAYTPVYREWLKMALLTRLSGKLSPARFDRYSRPTWRPRTFEWVDPQKEINAEIAAINAGIKSLSEVIAMRGRDIEEVLEEKAQEKELLALYDIQLPGSAPAKAPAPGSQNAEPEDEPDQPEEGGGDSANPPEEE